MYDNIFIYCNSIRGSTPSEAEQVSDRWWIASWDEAAQVGASRAGGGCQLTWQADLRRGTAGLLALRGEGGCIHSQSGCHLTRLWAYSGSVAQRRRGQSPEIRLKLWLKDKKLAGAQQDKCDHPYQKHFVRIGVEGLSIATGTGVLSLQCRCTTPA